MTYTQSIDRPSVAVIGGGAAGLLAAGRLLESGCRVTVFEHSRSVGRKLLITGKGRCNLTNDCTREELLENITKNPRFLYSAFSNFSSADTMRLFSEQLGVPLKTERGRRVFPVSDRSHDIVDALKRYARGAETVFEHVTGIARDEGGAVCGVVTQKAIRPFDAAILATGGKSYPLTGSDGSGYSIAEALGHTVTPIIPSLVPIICGGDICSRLEGLSLRNVALTIRRGESGKEIYRDFGELVFTSRGMSGPMILSASAHLRAPDISDLTAHIDLKPALDEKTLDARLRSDLEKYAKSDFVNSLTALLPSKLIRPFAEYTGISLRKQAADITREERRRILTCLKDFIIPITSLGPIEEAVITSGGVSVSEISPADMMSKKCPGLFFAGEIIDVDAYTGGYNLQIAFSTAALAASGAAKFAAARRN